LFSGQRRLFHLVDFSFPVNLHAKSVSITHRGLTSSRRSGFKSARIPVRDAFALPLAEARAWLRKAIDVGDAKEIKLRALDDPDLEPLWANIGKLGLA
jgi:hypothetical protein